METLDLLRLHLALEGKGIDDDGQLVRIPCPDPDTFTRVYVARHTGGDTILFRTGLPSFVRERLLGLALTDFFDFPERVVAILAEDGPCNETHIGKSYVFPERIGPADYPDVVRLSQLDPALVRHYEEELDSIQHEIFGILVDGQIVSTCQSSREDERAGEAWVRTLEAYRQRGYARQVTAAWGHWLQQQGKVPFYSHRSDNLASWAVAQSLGLIQYIEDAGYA